MTLQPIIKRLIAWLENPYPSSRHDLLSWLFLRGLALIYFAAFASMSVQIEGLVGVNGILPVQAKLVEITHFLPDLKYLAMPTLFWFDASDQSLVLACYLGMAASVLLLLGLFVRLALLACYLLYLSVTVAGQGFTAYQWDVFLLEIGFLALFLPSGSGLVVFLYRFLIARFMFMGGVVKIASGDPAWSGLTALDYHYLTQPLPTPLAYYAYYLPHWFNTFCVAAVFVIECVLPFLVFLPRRFRLVAAWSFIVLQCGIVLTGNYNFFNLLALLLCLLLFDDLDVGTKLPTKWVASIRWQQSRPSRLATVVAAAWLGVVMLVCATHFWIYHSKQMPAAPFSGLVQVTSGLSLVNNYGPFAVMTKERPEIIVQGSNDGEVWQDYLFNYKPDKLDKPLTWNIPHQPRLDWQMWFAALQQPAAIPWFGRFMLKLQEGSPAVLSLLANNPFPDKPPVYLRALLYRYLYTTPKQRRTTGQIWRREYWRMYWESSNAG